MSNAPSKQEFAQFKYLAEERREEFNRLFIDERWTWPKVANVITYYWRDDEAREMQLKTFFDKFEAELVKNSDEPEQSIWNRILNEGEQRRKFERNSRKQYASLLSSLDQFSRLASMGVYSKPKGGLPFHYLKPEFFLDPFRSWAFASIWGDPGTGKTNFAGVIMEMASQMKEFPVGITTNIYVEPEDRERYGIHFTRSLREMIMKCIENILHHGKICTLAITDEMPQYVNKKRSMGEEVLTMDMLQMLSRKVGFNQIGIAQREEDKTSLFASFCSIEFQKLSHDTMMCTNDGRTYIIGNVPETKIDYYTRHWASLEIDIDMVDLHRHLAQLPEEANQLREIYAYLDTTGKRNIEITEKDVDTFIRVASLKKQLSHLKGDGLSQKEMGQCLGMSQQAVSYRIAKLKKAGMVV